jgi:hypothetical protein
MAQGDRCIRAWCSQKNADDSGQAYAMGMASSQGFLVRALRISSPLILQFSYSTSTGYIIVRNLQPVQEKLPLYLGFFKFVHNVRKRGKALLHELIELLVR